MKKKFFSFFSHVGVVRDIASSFDSQKIFLTNEQLNESITVLDSEISMEIEQVRSWANSRIMITRLSHVNTKLSNYSEHYSVSSYCSKKVIKWLTLLK